MLVSVFTVDSQKRLPEGLCAQSVCKAGEGKLYMEHQHWLWCQMWGAEVWQKKNLQWFPLKIKHDSLFRCLQCSCNNRVASLQTKPKTMCSCHWCKSNLCIMDSSLWAPSDGIRGKQTLNKLHMLKIDVCAESPQAGPLAVLILYF